MKKKVILGSALTILMCSSLITGATMALFGTETGVNISVTSGKVDVSATVKTETVQTKQNGTDYEMGTDNTYTKEASVTENGEVLLNNIFPGDGIKFDIEIQNNSTADVKYRTKLTCREGDVLYDVLDIDIDGGQSLWTTWTRAEEDTRIVSVTIELPETVSGTDYQGVTSKLVFSVEAVQGNANTVDDIVVSASENSSDNGARLRAVLDGLTGDANITLEEGVYALDEPIVVPDGVNIYGAQQGVPASEWVNNPDAEKTIITAPTGSDRVIKVEQNEGETISEVIIDGIIVDGSGENVKGIFVKKYAGDPISNVVIRNTAVINCGNDAIDINNANGAVIENNYIEGAFDNGIQLASYDNAEGITSYIRDNVIKNISGTINGAIAVSGGKGDVVVSGNTIEGIRSNNQVSLPKVDMGESAIIVESVYEGGVITIENNNLTDVDQGIAVYKFSATTHDDKVIIRNNNINGAKKFAIATSTLNYKNSDALTVVEIYDNAYEGDIPAIGNMYIETVNRYNESTTGWNVIVDGTVIDDTLAAESYASGDYIIYKNDQWGYGA